MNAFLICVMNALLICVINALLQRKQQRCPGRAWGRELNSQSVITNALLWLKTVYIQVLHNQNWPKWKKILELLVVAEAAS